MFYKLCESIESKLKKFIDDYSKQSSNSEIQVAICVLPSGNAIFYCSENAGGKGSNAATLFEGKDDEISEWVNNNLKKDFNSITAKPLKSLQITTVWHAEMRIIYSVLKDLNDIKEEGFITIYIKGKKCPCVKCEELIEKINKLAANYMTIKVLEPATDVNQRTNVGEWTNPIDHLSDKDICNLPFAKELKNIVIN